MKKTVYVFAFFVLIGVLSLACLSPTISSPSAPTPVPPTPTESQPPASVDTPMPHPTSTPADIPMPLPTSMPADIPMSFPTSMPADTPTPEAQAFFTEEFNSSVDLWSYFIIDGYQEKNRLVEGDEPKVSVGTNNGYLVFKINKNYQYVYVTYDPYIYTNVRIDVRAENFGMNNNSVSLICRYSDQGWYEFNIANNGLYSILYAEWKPSKKVSYHLIANGGSNQIRMGKDVNEYTAICKGRTLQLFINGYETNTLTENRFALRKGQVGISVSSFNVLPVHVEFDWVKITPP
jgi:hypothetical protein